MRPVTGRRWCGVGAGRIAAASSQGPELAMPNLFARFGVSTNDMQLVLSRSAGTRHKDSVTNHDWPTDAFSWKIQHPLYRFSWIDSSWKLNVDLGMLFWSSELQPIIVCVQLSATKCGAKKGHAIKRGATKHGATKHGATKHGATKRGATKRGATKRGATKRGTMKHRDE